VVGVNQVVLSVDLLYEVVIGLCQELEIFTFDLEGELVVFPDSSVFNLVHLEQLTFENNEVTTFLS